MVSFRQQPAGLIENFEPQIIFSHYSVWNILKL